MKKLLLILALLAYAAISCDKPETTSVNEPETEQPAPVDTAADTCSIYIAKEAPGASLPTPVVMVYNTTSENVDFKSSANSIFQHFTITLNDGSLDTAIYTNAVLNPRFAFPSDTGSITGVRAKSLFDSIRYGSYLIVMWDMMNGGTAWGKNHHNPDQTFFYRDITFDSNFTAERIIIDEEFYSMIQNAEKLCFTKF